MLDEPALACIPRITTPFGHFETLRDLVIRFIVVEHDEDTILNADHIVDIGPRAGSRRTVVAQGRVEDIWDVENP